MPVRHLLGCWTRIWNFVALLARQQGVLCQFRRRHTHPPGAAPPSPPSSSSGFYPYQVEPHALLLLHNSFFRDLFATSVLVRLYIALSMDRGARTEKSKLLDMRRNKAVACRERIRLFFVSYFLFLFLILGIRVYIQDTKHIPIGILPFL